MRKKRKTERQKSSTIIDKYAKKLRLKPSIKSEQILHQC